MHLHDACRHSADPASTPERPAHEQMWDLITAYRSSQIVRVLARFGIAEHLAARPRTAEAIAATEGLDPDATFRLLRAAASLGLVESDDGHRFATTELLQTLVAEAPGSLRGLALALAEPGQWLPWGRLDESIRGGAEQARETLGADLREYYRRSPEEAAHVSEATATATVAVGEAAARAIDTTSFAVAAEIGGARGSLMHHLLAANLALRGIVFDLPHVAVRAADDLRSRALGDRLTTVGGDFMESVPVADAYLLRSILHHRNDAACVTILRNCAEAMRDGGRVFVLEMVIGPIGERSPAPLQDLQMLVGLPGGRERTIAEFESLLDEAGLRLVDATANRTPIVILEAASA